MTPAAHERGVALLTVLLIVALMAVVAASMLDRVGLATRLAANAGAQARARSYAQAIEVIATQRIGDLRAAKVPGARWQGREIAFRVPGGFARGRLVDGGNCFNVNAVVTADAQTGVLTADPAGMAQLANLIVLTGGSRNAGVQIAAALADWIDSDTNPVPGGVEDSGYRGRGALPANRLLADPTEALAIAGMAPEIARAIRPYLCALPVAGASPVNVDTLGEDRAVVLAMLADGGMTVPLAREVIAARPAGGYASAVAFWDQPRLAGVAVSDGARAQVGVDTRWYRVESEVEVAGAEHRGQTLIDAKERPAMIVSRRWGEP